MNHFHFNTKYKLKLLKRCCKLIAVNHSVLQIPTPRGLFFLLSYYLLFSWKLIITSLLANLNLPVFSSSHQEPPLDSSLSRRQVV